jgi:hypothetical protein
MWQKEDGCLVIKERRKTGNGNMKSKSKDDYQQCVLKKYKNTFMKYSFAVYFLS